MRPIYEPRWRWFAAALIAGLLLWSAAGFIGYSMAFAAGPITAHGGRACRSSVPCLKRAIRWQKRDRAHLKHQLAGKYHTDVELAYRLAIGIFHVDLRHLGYCESRNDPNNRTGQYVGITQQGNGFQARNQDVYRLLPVTNPIANVLVAARWISAHGSSEWQCRLDGSVKQGYS